MTVKELMEKLSKHDANLPVCIETTYGSDDGPYEVNVEIDTVQILTGCYGDDVDNERVFILLKEV